MQFKVGDRVNFTNHRGEKMIGTVRYVLERSSSYLNEYVTFAPDYHYGYISAYSTHFSPVEAHRDLHWGQATLVWEAKYPWGSGPRDKGQPIRQWVREVRSS